MQGRMTGGALRAHARSRVIPLVIAAVSVPALVAGQSVAAVAATAAPASSNVALAPMTPAQAAQLSQNVNQHVVVIMRNQPAAAHEGSHAATVRAGTITRQQAPFMSELREVHATHVKSYTLVNSFAATVSSGEEARLKANSSVAEVIPDTTIRLAQPETAAAGADRQDDGEDGHPDVRRADLADPERDPRRLLQRQGTARPRGPVADGRRFRTTRTSRPRARWASPARA